MTCSTSAAAFTGSVASRAQAGTPYPGGQADRSERRDVAPCEQHLGPRLEVKGVQHCQPDFAGGRVRVLV